MLPFLLAISGISAQCLTGNDNPMMMNPTSKMLLIDARLKFALESLKKTAKIQVYENIFFSPHSLHQAISLAYYAARGTTEASLKRILHIPDVSKIEMQRYYSFEKALDKMRDTEVRFQCALMNCASKCSCRSRQACQGESRFIVTSTPVKSAPQGLPVRPELL